MLIETTAMLKYFETSNVIFTVNDLLIESIVIAVERRWMYQTEQRNLEID